MKNLNKSIILVLAISAVAGVIAMFSLEGQMFGQTSVASAASQKTFYIATVHLDGITSIYPASDHPSEPYPNSTLPSGGGLVIKKIDNMGGWKIRQYMFAPSVIVVNQGDQVTLNFVDVQGPEHMITVDGIAPEFDIHRGEMKTVTFTADTVGTINFWCSMHEPNMRGEIVVLPRTN
ncbi:MAG TPA: cupredoxin domain-containing protein [Candidatus Nitrosotalea sp.]|nr:cupredoxin domain-containing protein [Nitrososphaerota archaeon]HKU33564.1 cupredoxin domain-containing protein [Candidatus Nitrosotalea sp.]